MVVLDRRGCDRGGDSSPSVPQARSRAARPGTPFLAEAGGDGAAAFEALEEVLHLVPLPVAAPIMAGRSLASHAGRYAAGVARVGHDP